MVGNYPKIVEPRFFQNQRDSRRNIMLNNRFGLLANTGASNDNDPSMDASAEDPKPKKPPPIEVQNIKLAELLKFLESAKGITCNLQYRISVKKFDNNVRETIKIYTQNDTDYQSVIKNCTEKKLEFNTHVR